MAGGKTIVGGTVYDVSGGKAMANSTVYDVIRGKTMVGSTVYDIIFDNIPSEYKRVKFINGPGGSYINLPFNVADGLRIAFSCKGSTDARYSAVIGSYGSSNIKREYFRIYDYSNNRTYDAYLGSAYARKTASSDFHSDAEHDISVDFGTAIKNTVMTVDGTTYTAASIYGDFEGGASARAFETISSSYPTKGSFGVIRRLNPSGEVLNELIPVYVVATGEAGFWDTVTEAFYGKSGGTNPFTYTE